MNVHKDSVLDAPAPQAAESAAAANGEAATAIGLPRAACGRSGPPPALCAELSAYVRKTFLPLRPDHPLAQDDDLIETGVLDSLAFIELVAQIGRRYRIEVADTDVTGENFGSIAAIARYVDDRRPR